MGVKKCNPIQKHCILDKYTSCAENNNKIITSREEKSEFIIHNPDKITIKRIKIDGCFINNNEKRCDYMFEINKPISHIIYLELKGTNIKKAYEQLKAIIEKFKEEHKDFSKICCIVTSSPPSHTSQTTKFKTELEKKGIQLIDGKTPLKRTISINKETQKLDIKH